MKVLNIRDVFIFENENEKFIYKGLLNDNDIDDYNNYIYKKNSLIFDNISKQIDFDDMVKLNDKNTISFREQNNYKILKITIKENYILLLFSNMEERLFYAYDINLSQSKINIYEIILANGSVLKSSFLYNNSILIRSNFDYIPMINKIINIDSNTIFCLYENGERRIFDITRYKNANIMVNESSYEEIYKYGREV